jgi:hypothetical protein
VHYIAENLVRVLTLQGIQMPVKTQLQIALENVLFIDMSRGA